MKCCRLYGLLALLILCGRSLCLAQTITTLAGSVYTFPADGIAAVNAPVGVVTAVAADKSGNIYFAELATDRVFKIDSKGILTRFAGNGVQGYAGDAGPATSASLFNPKGIAFDGNGNMYICDTGNFRIRKVTPAGVITTFAGNGTQGFSGDGGPATAASIGNNTRIAVDGSGFVYISDPDNHRIRRVAPGGTIATFAGNGVAASTGDGGPALQASLLNPAGLIIDTSGNLYFADTAAARVREIAFDGIITTVAGTGVAGTSGNGGLATKARINGPAGVAVDQNFNLYIADQTGSDIRMVTTTGTINAVAGITGVGLTGDGGPASASALYNPLDLFFSPGTGALLIADSNNFRVRSILNGIISTIAGNGNWRYTGDGGVATSATLPAPYGLAIAAGGNVNICDNYANRVRTINPYGIIALTAGTNIPGFSGDGAPATAASLVDCQGMAIDSSGNLYVADTGNGRIRRISAAGTISTVAGNGTSGFSGDGGLAIGASLAEPKGVAIDGAGNLYIADTNNNRIRKVSTSGTITTIAGNGNAGYYGDGLPATFALLNGPSRLALNSSGSIYFTDNGNNVVRSITPQGIMLTVAGNGKYGFSGDGGQAIAASLADPLGLAIDAAGNLLIADADNRRIRQVNTNGFISTLAGNGSATLSGDGRSPLSTGFGSPTDVALDAAGNIYISDHDNGRVRRIQASPSSVVLSQTGITFTGAVDSDSVPVQTLQILNGGAGTIGWTASASTSSGGNWLSVAPTQGTSTSTTTSSPVTVTANPAGLAAGNYYGQIHIASPGVVNSPRLVTVILTVLSAAQTTGASVSPAGLLFSGEPGGSNPASQTVTLSKLHGAALQFTASLSFGQASQWLTLTDSSTSVAPDKPAVITLKPNIAGLAAHVYTATLNLTFSDGSTTKVPATLVVANGAVGSIRGPRTTTPACTPTTLLPVMTALSSGFTLPAGWPVLIAAQVIDDCGQPLATGSVTATFSDGDPALPLASSLNGMWSGTWSPRKVANLTITLTAQESTPALTGAAQISGQLSANTDPPIVDAGGIVNAASFAPQGTASPGTLLAIFGSNLTAPTAAGFTSAASLPLPTELNNTQVLIGGVPMPLLFVSPGQINAMAPFGLASNTVHQVIVQNLDNLSVPEPATVNPAVPGAFTYNGTGSGLVLAVAINADGSSYLVTPSAPAHAGGVLVLYCTGLGAVQSSIEAGQAVPLSPLSPLTDPISVTIGGISANVLFAGLVPTFTGFYQVNLDIPASVTPGNSVPVIVTVGGASGPAATLAID
ncbi:MAG: IPT/TIG domain-containing protein [Bryobacteraceae bacterium]|jgi:uncharacterized protein (TIGR03437 family)